jgi:hypothetical protein
MANDRKLTALEVREIVERYRDGETGPVLAREYGVAPGQIYNIVSGKSWEIVTGITEPTMRPPKERFCRICGAEHYSHNYCQFHYETVYKPRPKQPAHCRICGDKSYTHGLCRNDYERWRSLVREKSFDDPYVRLERKDDYVTLAERNKLVIDHWLAMLANGHTLWAKPAWGLSANYDPALLLDFVVKHNPNREQIEKMKARVAKDRYAVAAATSIRFRRIGQEIITQARRTAITIENDVRWAIVSAGV